MTNRERANAYSRAYRLDGFGRLADRRYRAKNRDVLNRKRRERYRLHRDEEIRKAIERRKSANYRGK